MGEGYQADLLSAIGDIERKGEFEFGEEGWAEANAELTNAQRMATQGGVTGKLGQRMLADLAKRGIVPQTTQSGVTNPTQVDDTQTTQEMQGYYDQQYG